MSTKRTVSLICLMATLLEVCRWLSSKTGNDVFIFSVGVLSVVGFALMFYAMHREKTYGDKSETVSRRTVITTFSGIALWVAFVLFRALAN